jgi:phage-related baseplate assembly protein
VQTLETNDPIQDIAITTLVSRADETDIEQATQNARLTALEASSPGSGNNYFVGQLLQIPSNIFTDNDDAKNSGLLALVGGYTIAGGASTYNDFAAACPNFISDSDIVVPAWVDDVFLRNAGGNAATELTEQLE